MSSNAREIEADSYTEVGASASKEGVHRALGKGRSAHFCELLPDPADPENYFAALHADGAGTKSIPAYILFRETGAPSVFSSLSQDSLVMNLDDLACVGAFEGLILSNTIGRNRFLIPDDVVSAVIDGYKSCVAGLREQGIEIALAGGETADMGDVIRTLVVDSTLSARVRKDAAVSTNRIAAGDIIIGLSSTGRAKGESRENSGIGSNGLTLARHALIHRKYAERYPEIMDPALPLNRAYRGALDLFDNLPGTSLSVGEALLSPTRSFAPIIRRCLLELGDTVHGIIHCTGGGQTKALRFGRGVRFIKDELFPCPGLFALIQSSGGIPWREMYSVFNMGHRMEILTPPDNLKTIVDIARDFGVEAKRIGFVDKSPGENALLISGPEKVLEYSL